MDHKNFLSSQVVEFSFNFIKTFSLSPIFDLSGANVTYFRPKSVNRESDRAGDVLSVMLMTPV